MFISEGKVHKMIASAMVILSVFVFFDCMQSIGVGMIRGLGKQGIASVATVVGYWVIGIPLSLVCVFYYNLGIVGLWYGPTTAIIFNFLIYYIIVIKTDW